MVGNLQAYFLSCYRSGRSPILNLGPDWRFTIGLLCFAAMCLIYVLGIGWMAKTAPFKHKVISYCCIIFNLFLLFGGILGNPGVPQAYIDKLLKSKEGKGDDSEDLEAGPKRGTVVMKRKGWCEEC